MARRHAKQGEREVYYRVHRAYRPYLELVWVAVLDSTTRMRSTPVAGFVITSRARKPQRAALGSSRNVTPSCLGLGSVPEEVTSLVSELFAEDASDAAETAFLSSSDAGPMTSGDLHSTE